MGFILKDIVDTEYSDKKIAVGDPCPYCNKGRAIGNESEMPGALALATMNDFNPSLYRADMSKYMRIFNDFWQHFDVWQSSAKGLYLWSKEYGSGKTFLACCLANSAKTKHHVRIKYITAIEYIDRCSNFNSGHSVKQEILPYLQADILILDDLGAEKKSDWNLQCLNRLIDYRYSHLRVTLYTSNVEINDLAEGRISNRIYRGALQVHFPEESIRQKLAEKDNADFIRGIMSRQSNKG